MKRYLIIALFISLAGFLFAQENEIGGANAEQIGIDSAQQQLKEISVDKFEMDGYWRSTISGDDGYSVTRLFEGSPASKEPIPEEEGLNIPDKYALGTRVDFLRRGYHSIFFYPQQPIPIEGITKTISIWVAGRNYNHELKILIQDFFGHHFELYVGNLNFQGWKKLTVAIPPQAEDGRNGIIQRNYYYNNQMGIKIEGLKIDCDPTETWGSYYVYFDDLRAVTDLFAENNRDADDIPDGW
ncbi:flagellar filament protein FlaA [Spirochaetia bacterium]|nr:flagellar filament protein FlaA [Spirochaetia bacterium]